MTRGFCLHVLFLHPNALNSGHTCVLPLRSSDALPAAIIEKVLLGLQRTGGREMAAVWDVHSAQCLRSPEERTGLQPGDESAPSEPPLQISAVWFPLSLPPYLGLMFPPEVCWMITCHPNYTLMSFFSSCFCSVVEILPQALGLKMIVSDVFGINKVK